MTTMMMKTPMLTTEPLNTKPLIAPPTTHDDHDHDHIDIGTIVSVITDPLLAPRVCNLGVPWLKLRVMNY